MILTSLLTVDINKIGDTFVVEYFVDVNKIRQHFRFFETLPSKSVVDKVFGGVNIANTSNDSLGMI